MISCLIVDDEPLAIELIEKYLLEYDDIAIAGKCNSTEELINTLQCMPVDLIFLDIQLPGVDGISFLSTVSGAPYVIFTTAHREFAVQAFDLGVIDYLLKPISPARFSKAIDRLRAAVATGPKPYATDEALATPLALKSGTEYFKILPAEILYIQARKDYIFLVTAGKKYMVRDTLKNILQKLPEDTFLQVHRSYIIPVRAVTSVSTNYIRLNNIKIPIGPSYLPCIKERFIR